MDQHKVFAYTFTKGSNDKKTGWILLQGIVSFETELIIHCKPEQVEPAYIECGNGAYLNWAQIGCAQFQ